MARTYTHIAVHVVFSTKHREALISPEWKDRLFQYAGGIARAEECVLLSAGGVADHVHLLVGLHPSAALADLIRAVKAKTSGWLKREVGVARFAWQDGYSAFSVSKSNEVAVRKYLANQEKHHRRMSFEEELVLLLKKHGVEYDPKHVMD